MVALCLEGPMVVLGGGVFLMSEEPLHGRTRGGNVGSTPGLFSGQA